MSYAQRHDAQAPKADSRVTYPAALLLVGCAAKPSLPPGPSPAVALQVSVLRRETRRPLWLTRLSW
jgi:hypothetical protein